MPIGVGVNKNVYVKKQSALGTIATGGAATGQILRRTKSTIDLQKQTYKSAEILTSMQRRDFRHGVRSVAGVISGELSVGAYELFMESICRQLSQAVVSSTALTNITSAVTSGAAGTFTRAAGSFLTDGFKVGDVVNSTGWATTGVPNNNHYSVITALTALIMTVLFLDGVAMGAKASGDTVTIVQAGQKTYPPLTAQTRDYYTIEHWMSDVALSERFTDCVVSKMDVKLPPTGMATVDFTVMGLNMSTAGTVYFSSPTAQTTGGIEAAVNGVLLVQGVVVAIVTGFDFSVNGNYSAPGGVVGANVDPDIFPGSIDVTGNMTILLQDATFRDYFVNETEFTITVVLNATTAANSPFVAFNFPRVKAGGASKDDGEKGLTLTMPFTALEQTAGGAAVNALDTTFSIQDSAFA